ncbi:MAG: hypothetical protein RLZZ34_2479, partial [Verrucomicrobiota bacterium]
MTVGLLVAADQPRAIRVFLLAGQSNMEGADSRARRIDEFPEFQGAGAPQPEVLFTALSLHDTNASTVWSPLAPGDSFGPEITFARKLTRSGIAPIALIKSAVGGTTMAFDWNPAAPAEGQRLYPRTLKLVREALQALDR